MSLKELISRDTKNILEDTDTGFGWGITVTNPDGVSSDGLKGYSNDIAEMIDVDTGVAVSGRTASVAIHLDSLSDQGLEIPVGIADKSKKPWIVEFNDILGNPYTFKVSESRPDRAMGVVVCLLECYGS